MKNKRAGHISKIMSKRLGIFTQKRYYLFSNARKIGNLPNLNLINSRRSSFGDTKHFGQHKMIKYLSRQRLILFHDLGLIGSYRAKMRF